MLKKSDYEFFKIHNQIAKEKSLTLHYKNITSEVNTLEKKTSLQLLHLKVNIVNIDIALKDIFSQIV